MSNDDSARRKGQPIARGNLLYFPDAHLAVAELSRYGNDKHNPGEPLHWSKEKSNDHSDCCVRHLLEPFGIDYSYGADKPVLHAAAAAWRALANLQTEIDALRAKGEWPLKPRDVVTAPVSTSGGWHTWEGGSVPPADNAKVEVRYKDGKVSAHIGLAQDWDWCHIGDPGYDIAAWRFAK